MRWLPILILALLVASVLSIVLMNDNSQWPGSDRSQGTPVQPSDEPLLAPAPKTNP
jgi:ABC-type cobalt transport system substrate-binding protein